MAKSKVSAGTKYEKFVQSIYQALHNQSGFTNVRVEQNKTDLKGRSGCCHQLDVYWEFEIAGQIYQTAIECKAFDKNVPIGRVRDFYGVLADVPKLNGIMVSLVGFQAGAQKYAEHFGIELREVRPPTVADFDGRIKTVHIRSHRIMPRILNIEPLFSQRFLETLAAGEQLEWVFEGTNYDPLIVKSDGETVASHEDIRQALPATNQPKENQVKILTYADAHLRIGEREVAREI